MHTETTTATGTAETHAAWEKLLREYARILGVRVYLSPEVPVGPRRRSWRAHPSVKGFFFSRPERAVRIAHPDLASLALWDDAPLGAYAPHEVTHAIWPGRIATSPEEEWASGMMPFEMAWMRRLCTDPNMFRVLAEYAKDGQEEDGVDAEAAARRVISKHHLPDPWSTP